MSEKQTGEKAHEVIEDSGWKTIEYIDWKTGELTSVEQHEPHETVFVKVGAKRRRGQGKFVGMDADIDIEIAPLIEKVWRAGFHTFNSCQENQPGIIWIEFDLDDGLQFLNIVADEYSDDYDSLYNRIRHGWETKDKKSIDWEFAINLVDWSIESRYEGENGEPGDIYCIETPTGPPNFIPFLSVRFPKEDLTLVEERMRQHNRL